MLLDRREQAALEDGTKTYQRGLRLVMRSHVPTQNESHRHKEAQVSQMRRNSGKDFNETLGARTDLPRIVDPHERVIASSVPSTPGRAHLAGQVVRLRGPPGRGRGFREFFVESVLFQPRHPEFNALTGLGIRAKSW